MIASQSVPIVAISELQRDSPLSLDAAYASSLYNIVQDLRKESIFRVSSAKANAPSTIGKSLPKSYSSSMGFENAQFLDIKILLLWFAAKYCDLFTT
ncbi:MAG TPA: hypothetical protein DEG17_15475 [Cyanobacteria bacterium UBA11149]|nr:hypothetical protein [Cyanobacteria bacterium UBA11367]HBK65849.1 hypothetical protein [Cyanobacteria bacterium UBA11166]HBR72861.1 hypothetical protein [Cyanobacteria bacterium UBA11159]HBS67825.1 hypothetical protein [Cyanobacteria bacterium UBA11153]HBW90234.1 hypothetical protein [Cyanobacteria bacterium UBA11149]